MTTDYTDDVSGHVVGDMTAPYQFWLTEDVGSKPVSRCVARGHFTSDDEAVAWFCETYPTEFAHGVEMRVYDQ